MTQSPRVAVVAGSGLQLDGLLDVRGEELPFASFPGLDVARVQGHEGKFVVGRCGDVPIVLQQGRLHFYEGHDFEAVVRTVDVLAGLGVHTVLFTNAAGGLRPEMQPGDLMAATSISLWPCARWPSHPSELELLATPLPCDWTGVYHWVHGPSYETRAEIGALRSLNRDAVGMSTAPEAAHCAKLGIRAYAVSCITNNCCRPHILTHEHVLATARTASNRLISLIRDAIPALQHREPLGR